VAKFRLTAFSKHCTKENSPLSVRIDLGGQLRFHKIDLKSVNTQLDSPVRSVLENIGVVCFFSSTSLLNPTAAWSMKRFLDV